MRAELAWRPDARRYVKKRRQSHHEPHRRTCSKLRDQSLSVISWAVSVMIVDPTTHVPVRRSGDRPPAMPKLIRPRQPSATAHASDVASVRPSPLQTARVSAPATIRASSASPTTPMTATKRALPETTTRDRRSREAADFDSQLHLCNIERPTHRTDRWAQGQSAIVSDVPDRNAHLRLFNCRVLIAASSLAQSTNARWSAIVVPPARFPLSPILNSDG